MEEDLSFRGNGRWLQSLANGRQSQYFGKQKTISIFFPMEDNFIVLEKGRQSHYLEIEDDLNLQ